MDRRFYPGPSNWALVREGQQKTLSLPLTAMTVTIDLGEWNDVHPLRKKEVGERLALLARKTVYGEKGIVASGPLFKNSEIKNDGILVRFENTGTGLVSSDGEPLSQFAIAGADKKFVWAKARIEGDAVFVWNAEVANPQYVRYAWADNPEGANLYNREGLPAAPFRTDK
jgi:sialate O-acetylesterase